MSKSAALLLGLALLCLSATAIATPRRIAVLEPDLELLRALRLALSPWGVETIRSDAPAASSAPDAIRIASALARQLDAEAVVWVSRTERGSLLWVFDADTGEVSTRMLAESTPFDGASAAAVALSVKTVLRSSQIAPPSERFGAPAPPSPRDRVLSVELGADLWLVTASELEPRFGLAPTAWLTRELGVSLELSSGPGLRVERRGYRGRYRELVLGGEARLRLGPTTSTWATLSLGASAHGATLRGSFVGTPERTTRRWNASLDAEAAVGFPVGGGVYVGAALGGAYFPKYRRYLVESVPVFVPGPWASNLGGYVGVELF